MRKADRDRKPSRQTPFRDPRQRIVIVCEGRTEKDYIDGFVKNLRARTVSTLNVQVIGQAGVPMTVVENAKQIRQAASEQASRENDDNLSIDSVWAVFDVDDHPNVENAKIMATDNGVQCAVSNACFELWLYLHFQDNPGIQHRGQLLKLVKAIIPSYDKRPDFKTFSNGLAAAVSRAEKMDIMADEDGESGRNPSTGIWKLIQAIQKCCE
jgi:hypothetical protein